MRGDEFLDKMESVDAGLIEEAARRPQVRRTRRLSWIAAAACVILVLLVAIGTGKDENPDDDTEDPGTMPLLTIDGFASGGQGYEGYLVYEISDIVNANPWRPGMTLPTLPVYENPILYDEESGFLYGDIDQMKARLYEYAELMGCRIGEGDIHYQRPGGENDDSPAYGVSATKDGISFEVHMDLTVTINFEPAVSVPSQYDFSYSSTYEELEAASEYFKDAYKNLIRQEEPVLNIYGGDYSFNLDRGFSFEFYDGAGSTTEQIVNYNFNRVSFAPDDEGNLMLIRIFEPDLSQKAGDYPIITETEAAKLLEEGHYVTSAPYEMPGMDYVERVELVYRTDEYSTYFMPYYRFYVELPEEEALIKEQLHGLKVYGAYYVPAVKAEYLTNMPTWDGSFN